MAAGYNPAHPNPYSPCGNNAISRHSAPQAGASFRHIAEHPQDGLPWYAEIEKLDSEECQEALVMGWRRGLFAKTEAAKG